MVEPIILKILSKIETRLYFIREKETTTIKVRQPVSKVYDLRYMNSFAKAAPLLNRNTINFWFDFLMTVHY